MYKRQYLDLENWLRGLSRSLKLVPFKSLGVVSYSPSIVTMAVSVAVCDIFIASKNDLTLKTGLGFAEGHWKWHQLIDRIRVLILKLFAHTFYHLRVI